MKKTMKAAVYHGPQDMRVEEVEIRAPKEKEVLVKVAYCGVCGTDIHIYNGDGGATAVTPPLIPGHEFSGIVEAVGEGVTSVKPGDKVTVDPNNICDSCYFCKNEMSHFCTNMIGYGTTMPGGFAEYTTVAEKVVYKLSEDADLLEACMTEPLSCCLHGIDLCNIKLGDTVVVIGAGSIGSLMIQLARQAGASKVIVSDPVEEKRQLALELGADLAVDPIHEDVAAILKNVCENVDVVIECVGSIMTIKSAIEFAGKGATVMMFGLTDPDAELPIKPHMVFEKELHITSSYINPRTFDRSIKLLEAGRLDVKKVMSHILPLEDIVTAVTDVKMRQSGKIVIKL